MRTKNGEVRTHFGPTKDGKGTIKINSVSLVKSRPGPVERIRELEHAFVMLYRLIGSATVENTLIQSPRSVTTEKSLGGITPQRPYYKRLALDLCRSYCVHGKEALAIGIRDDEATERGSRRVLIGKFPLPLPFFLELHGRKALRPARVEVESSEQSNSPLLGDEHPRLDRPKKDDPYP
jgi:hypothetical protein